MLGATLGVSPLIVLTHSGHHAVRFYSEDDAFCACVADFLGEGIAAHRPVLVIATSEHRQKITSELARRGVNIGGLIYDGHVVLIDARQAVGRIFVHGQPNGLRFREIMGELMMQASGNRGDVAVCAYGEMVDLLWREGRHGAAIEVERLWNELATTHAFSLLCGYSSASFSSSEHTERDEICAHHTHVHA
jgi:MEDS: MEthanogen/methylotroph, DcmR Sensory domain